MCGQSQGVFQPLLDLVADSEHSVRSLKWQVLKFYTQIHDKMYAEFGNNDAFSLAKHWTFFLLMIWMELGGRLQNEWSNLR